MKLSAITEWFETSKYLALKRYAAKKEVSLGAGTGRNTEQAVSKTGAARCPRVY